MKITIPEWLIPKRFRSAKIRCLRCEQMFDDVTGYLNHPCPGRRLRHVHG